MNITPAGMALDRPRLPRGALAGATSCSCASSCRARNIESLAGHAAGRAGSRSSCRSTSSTKSEFFTADDAPREIAQARRSAFMRLADLYAQRFPKTAAASAEIERGVSDVQFTCALSRAVPVQRVRAAASEGGQLPAVLERRGGHRSRRQSPLRSHGLVRRERLRLRLLQGMHRARRAPRRGSRPGARRLPPRARLQREAAARDFAASTKCRFTCRAPKP